LKDSLLIPGEFFNAKKLQTLQGAKINSSDKSESNRFLLERRLAALVFWLKFQELFTNYLSNVRSGRARFY